MSHRRRHLAQLARVLPRADQLFATPRQRFDTVAGKLGNALYRNLQEHRRAFVEAAALLRPQPLRRHVTVTRDRIKTLGTRAETAVQTKLAESSAKLSATWRLLDGISYRGILARGFALVRGADGQIRRRAADVVDGEQLLITFADNARTAAADGEGIAAPKPRSRAKPKGGPDQESLF